MANKLNKHTPNSDELLKRLETNDAAGLDDFEKEAMEGFASLESPELARSLQAKLDARISEEYSQRKSGNRTFLYLSMAAGLILIIGLTVIFYNSLNSNKAELALSESAEQKESVPGELAPVEELRKELEAASYDVFCLNITQLLSHLDMSIVFHYLPNLSYLTLTYGAKHVGMEYERPLFGMKMSDAKIFSECLKST